MVLVRWVIVVLGVMVAAVVVAVVVCHRLLIVSRMRWCFGEVVQWWCFGCALRVEASKIELVCVCPL